MYDLQQLLIFFGMLIIFIIITLLKKYVQNPFGFFLLLPCLGLILFAYVAFSKYQLNNYYKQALTSPEQIRYCGIFEWVEVEQQTRQGIIKEKVFYFQNDRQGFLFSNSLRARQQFPELKILKEKDQICFQFSVQYKDENGRYILTAFTLQKRR